jgi:hypothetical protein
MGAIEARNDEGGKHLVIPRLGNRVIPRLGNRVIPRLDRGISRRVDSALKARSDGGDSTPLPTPYSPLPMCPLPP